MSEVEMMGNSRAETSFVGNSQEHVGIKRNSYGKYCENKLLQFTHHHNEAKNIIFNCNGVTHFDIKGF